MTETTSNTATATSDAGAGTTALTGAGDASGANVSGAAASAAQAATGQGTGQGAEQSGAGAGNGNAGEKNTESGATAEEGTKDADEGKGALEYTDFKVPEGVTLNPELLGEFKDVAKGLGLKQEQAQQLADLGVKMSQKLVADQAAAFEAQKTGWLEAVKADKEIGGDKLPANLAIAAKALNAFATPELKQLLDWSGLGNHPDMVKTFVNLGKLISEDALVPGGKAPVKYQGRTAAEQAANGLYGGQS